MKKTYWWRILILLSCIFVLLISFFIPCEQKIGKCIGGNNIIITRTLFHYFLSFLIVSPFLFLIKDVIFKKWFKFAIVWFVLLTIFIILSPEYSSDIFGLSPTKELVSIWMSSLFVIISLIQIIFLSIRQKNN